MTTFKEKELEIKQMFKNNITPVCMICGGDMLKSDLLVLTEFGQGEMSHLSCATNAGRKVSVVLEVK